MEQSKLKIRSGNFGITIRLCYLSAGSYTHHLSINISRLKSVLDGVLEAMLFLALLGGGSENHEYSQISVRRAVSKLNQT